MSNTNEKIRLEHITKRWGEVVAVDDLNLKIEKGDFITLLGPSGCGKTTTLRAIAGLDEPTEGKIFIDNKLIFSKKEEIIVEPSKRNLGLIFQSYALWPHMTVFQNIAFPLQMKKLPKPDIKKYVAQALKDVRLQGYKDRYPAELSGGQQQRIAIARMLINRPDIYLMDEPLSNLDARLRIEMRAELKQLHQKLEATTVYVTHDQVEAMTISSRVCVMNEGVIQQIGTPEDVYRRPANLFVARFISNPQMNFFDGTVKKENGKMVVEAGGFRLPVDEEKINGRDSVIVAVRPEDFYIADDGVEYHVDAQLPAGSSQIIMVSRPGEEQVALLFEGTFKNKDGEKMKLAVKPETYNIFDKETEKVLV
ncbi:MAG: ABC transporter ATP-binding protein [Spirochaetaceae bacterium]|nr:ABC transporter ATP-binding protein [Spirochaetaceae bacterium]MCF7947319.1 ABC transporter ATP-binding protein [Spirochaetia bacterium]MCF7950545.1 ABC transporter ATP-binding protein [Spirochaetaceae bacterium]